MQGGFSLMVFGWTQIVMDVQPLIVLMTDEGHLHGFTHTYIGATIIAILAGLTGKYLSQIGLWRLGITPSMHTSVSWRVAIVSAFIGSFSHVFLDSIMHFDVQPFYPLTLNNPFLGIISIGLLHKLCLYSGFVGAAVFFFAEWRARNS